MTVSAPETISAIAVHPVPVPTAAAAHVDVSVVIVTWNSEGWIEQCLRSIGPASLDRSFEVIIQDNASADGTLEIATSLQDEAVTVLKASRNHGFAGGINRAAAQARGDYVFLLNPDCELAPGALAHLVEYLEAHHDVAAVAPLLYDEQGNPQREFQLRRLPTLGSLVAEILLIKDMFPENRISARYRYRDLDITVPQAIEQPAGAALLMRRRVLEHVGPFDEGFSPAWFEDVDYCKRLAAHGHAIHLVPSATATHFGGASLEHVRYEDFLSVWYRNLFRYAGKWMRRGEVETLRWTIILGMLLRSAATIGGLGNRRMRGASVRSYLRIARQAFDRWEADRAA